MSEFHEVECPDGIGLGGGVWEMRVRIKKKSSPTFGGERVLAEWFLITTNIQMLLDYCC